MLLTLLAGFLLLGSSVAMHWQHSHQPDEDFRLLWSVDAEADEITIELQARTHGYVGLGFARAGDQTAGADVIVGWVDEGQTYLQDRYFPKNGHPEPVDDPSQDVSLLLGYENRTHTVLRFRRPLSVACDHDHDVAITADTQSLFYMLHSAEPVDGLVTPGSLPSAESALSPLIPLQLLRRTDANLLADKHSAHLDLRNGHMKLPMAGETVQWCRVFELHQFQRKHHIVRFEPLFDTAASRDLMQELVLYECQAGDSSERLAKLASQPDGQLCVSQRERPTLPCNAIVAAWRSGSTGLTFPAEAGFPIDSNKERFYLMETQYSNRAALGSAATAATADLGDLASQPPVSSASTPTASQPQPQTDNSGLRLHVTSALRPNDAGVLSLGIHPEWRHIIPPGHDKVISEGHCVDDCTRAAFPAHSGISIFALLPQSKHIATRMRLRQMRGTEDLPSVDSDTNVHSGYAEYRRVEPAAQVLRGDRLVVECTYDSSERGSITLGGHAPMNERCQMLAVYWPRQKRLTSCESLPSLPTVLHSLGIEELSSSSTMLIKSPAALAGISLEDRVLSYDWATEFENFQRTTIGGSFQAFCTDARHKSLARTDTKEYFRPRVNRVHRPSPPPAAQCPQFAVAATATADGVQPSVIVAGNPKKRHEPAVTIVDMGQQHIEDAGQPINSSATVRRRGSLATAILGLLLAVAVGQMPGSRWAPTR